MFDGAIFDSAIFDTGTSPVVLTTGNSNGSLLPWDIIGPRPPRPRKGRGYGTQAPPTGSGEGYLNDDELVLLALF